MRGRRTPKRRAIYLVKRATYNSPEVTFFLDKNGKLIKDENDTTGFKKRFGPFSKEVQPTDKKEDVTDSPETAINQKEQLRSHLPMFDCNQETFNFSVNIFDSTSLFSLDEDLNDFYL